MMRIMIVREEDRPYFISDDRKGDCVLLNFGMEYVDDIEIASERYFIFLHQSESVWQAGIDKDLSHGIVHRDAILELIVKINHALEAGGIFDVTGYAILNKKEYAHLSQHVCWIEKYRPQKSRHLSSNPLIEE